MGRLRAWFGWVLAVGLGAATAGHLARDRGDPPALRSVAWAGPGEDNPDGSVSFGSDVRPILARSCLACHGFDPSTRKADLRLDTYEFATGERPGGAPPAIVPGDPARSLLLARVGHADPEERMPPEGEPLSEAEIDILRRWIEQGAEYEPHWSLRPVEYVEPPAVADRDWTQNPIDAFVRARLDAAGLTPAGGADRRTLLRRVTFDLTGLPPTEEETRAFVADDSPDAYQRVVDRLLDSPRFGERWARHWLDLMRYAETYAHEFDYPIRHAYQYRDYVIRAFNADVPYDRFVTEHLAGDLLPEPRRNPEHGFNESVIATGFWWLSQGTHGPVDVRLDEAERIDNQIDVLSKALLATTVSCARCHDHKFDPIYTREYYGLAGFIQSSRRQEAYLDPDGRIASAIGVMRRADGAIRAEAERSVRPALVEQAGGVAALLLGAGEVLFGEPKPGETPPSGRDRVIEAFDGDAYTGWTVQGDAFTDSPTPAGPDGLAGEGTARGVAFANTHRRLQGEGSVEADARVGSITSEPFTIDRDFLHFLIGGGNHPGKTGLRLLVDGAQTRDATGNNSLRLEPRRFDVSEFRGREAVVQIFDEVRGGWGNIRVDQIVLSDEATSARPARRSVEAVAAERSLDEKELLRWVRAIQAVEVDDRRHPMASIVRGMESAGGRADASIPREPEGAATVGDGSAGVAFDFSAPGEFGRWFKSGWAFGGEAARAGDWRSPGSGWEIVDRSCADSGGLSDRLMGTLRSQTFEITHPYLAVLARGRGTTRVIVDGFTMDEYNDLLFHRCKLEIDVDDWAWQVHDVRKYVGHRAHFEIIDDRQDSSLQIERAVWMDADRAPGGLDGAGTPADATTVAGLAEAVADAVRLALAGDRPSALGVRAARWMLDWGLLDARSDAIDETRRAFDSAAADCPAPMRAFAMEDGTGEDEYVFIRGDHRQRGETAPRGFIGAICDDPTIPVAEGSGRLQLARKILDDSNPLPARVMVNRVWHHLIGRGIVETADDFGLLGRAPTHPELLDHLAWRFRNEMGWSVKRLIREIVTSRTYRMSSGPRADEAVEIDPRNLLLSAREIRRLDGESIRDAILLAAGTLDTRMYGPSVPVHLTPFMTGRGRPGQSGPLDGDGRRSVYVEVRRNFLSPMMTTFDAPNPHSTIGKRSESNVPAQSLILLNDPFVVGQAEHLAQSLLAEAGSPAERIDRLYRRALTRAPTAGEIAAAGEFLREQAAARGDGDAWAESRGAWTDLCHVVFNLKEFVFLQ